MYLKGKNDLENGSTLASARLFMPKMTRSLRDHLEQRHLDLVLLYAVSDGVLRCVMYRRERRGQGRNFCSEKTWTLSQHCIVRSQCQDFYDETPELSTGGIADKLMASTTNVVEVFWPIDLYSNPR